MLMVVVYAAAGLRHRSAENKAVIVNQVEKIVWPAIVAGKVKPVVHKSLISDFWRSEGSLAHGK